ncbi:MAG: hypothetical protein ACYCSN_05555 [Acidobacteriaceae bacterium]
MDNIWLLILKEALDGLVARMDAPVAGAKLRAAVKRLAEDRGEQFPPEGMDKWSTFLSAFPDEITVIPNPGSDVLVVPASRLDLRAKAEAAITVHATPASKRTRLRSDIFEALTRIPAEGERPLYLPETDAVLWSNALEATPANAVPFPTATFDGEMDLRQAFVARSEGMAQMAKDALRAALDSDGPLRQFTHAIRSYGLIQDWHLFRMAALSERLRNWATAHALAFKDDWFGSEEPRTIVTPAAALAATAAGNKRGLVELAGLLTDDDISRISVPLDIVLRLLTPR